MKMETLDGMIDDMKNYHKAKSYIKSLGVFTISSFFFSPYSTVMPEKQYGEYYNKVVDTLCNLYYPFRVKGDEGDKNTYSAMFVVMNIGLEEMKSLMAKLNVQGFYYTDKVSNVVDENDTFDYYLLNKDYYQQLLKPLCNKAEEAYKDCFCVVYEGDCIQEMSFTEDSLYSQFAFFNFHPYDNSKYEKTDCPSEISLSYYKEMVIDTFCIASNVMGKEQVCRAIYAMMNPTKAGVTDYYLRKQVLSFDTYINTIKKVLAMP